MNKAREVIAEACRYRWIPESERPWERVGPLAKGVSMADADAILSALIAARIGLYDLATEVKVERVQCKRVRRAAAACGVVYWFDNDEARGEAESAWLALQPGDTDPVPEV